MSSTMALISSSYLYTNLIEQFSLEAQQRKSCKQNKKLRSCFYLTEMPGEFKGLKAVTVWPYTSALLVQNSKPQHCGGHTDLKDSFDPYTTVWHSFPAGHATLFPLIYVSPLSPLQSSPPTYPKSLRLSPLFYHPRMTSLSIDYSWVPMFHISTADFQFS